MVIEINRRLVIVLAATTALVACAAVAARSLSGRPGAGNRQPTSEWSLGTSAAASNRPAEAAAQFARAFYTVDYQNQASWLRSLRPLSTSDGYIILEKNIAPVLWPKLVEARTVSRAAEVAAEDRGLVIEGFSKIGGPWQIRALSIVIAGDALWPTMKSPRFTANILLGQQDGKWRFASFATQAQIDQLKQLTGEQQ